MTASRTRIRQLDGCLDHLESASERGVKRVPASLAQRVSGLVPGVSAGQPVAQAIELVFQAQEAAQRSGSGNPLSVSNGYGDVSADSLAPVAIALDGADA